MNPIKLFKEQADVVTAAERFIVAVAGVQGGKTTVGAAWLCSEIYKNLQAGKKGADYLIAAPTHDILRQSTLRKFNEVFPKDWGEWHEKGTYYELVWGDRIFVRSTDDPDHLEGMTLHAAWLDEAGQMKQQVWTNIQARVGIKQGRVLFTTTPYSMGWFYKELIKSKDSNVKLVTWPSSSNPSFNKEELERAERTLPKAVFERRYLGQFTQLEGLVYPDFNDECIIEPISLDGCELFGGMDFGQTNPTAIVCVGHDPKSDVYYVFKEFYRSESLLNQSASFIQSNNLKYVLADPQSAQLIVELNRHHNLGNVKPAENNIDLGIQRLSALFKAGRIKIFKTCDNLIDELETYHYPSPDRDGEVKDKPVAKRNHACDALRYAFSKFQEKTIYRDPNFNPLDTSNPLAKSTRKRYYPQMTRRDIKPDPVTGYF